MRTVWKIPIHDEFTTAVLPSGANFLHFDRDTLATRGSLSLAAWFEVDTDRVQQMSRQTLQITGTGHMVPDTAEYLGSYVTDGFAWHLWRMP